MWPGLMKWNPQIINKNIMLGKKKIYLTLNPMYVCGCVHVSAGAGEDQKREWDPLEQELYRLLWVTWVSCPTWVLRTDHRVSVWPPGLFLTSPLYVFVWSHYYCCAVMKLSAPKFGYIYMSRVIMSLVDFFSWSEHLSLPVFLFWSLFFIR